MRTTFAGEPGMLADLAAACGEAGVDILGLQIVLGLVGVTDELVLCSPRGIWDGARRGSVTSTTLGGR